MVGTSGLRFVSVLGWLWVPAQQQSQGALEHGLLAESTLESDPPLFLLGPESCVRGVGVHKLSLFGLIWFPKGAIRREAFFRFCWIWNKRFSRSKCFCASLTIPLLFSDLPETGLLREKAEVREVKASREMVLCFRLSGIPEGWAAKAHEEGETLHPKMPSCTLEMRHRAQIAGVCPGSF